MEIGHQEKCYFGKMDVGKNGNLEELKFEKNGFSKRQVLQNANQEKFNFGKCKSLKMKI